MPGFHWTNFKVHPFEITLQQGYLHNIDMLLQMSVSMTSGTNMLEIQPKLSEGPQPQVMRSVSSQFGCGTYRRDFIIE